MTYHYDNYGWLTSQPLAGRSTSIAPPAETATLKANWTGKDWVLVTYTEPPAFDTKQAQREAILEQLSEIDAQSDTPRMRREIRLGVQAGAARLAGLEAQAVALRMQLTNLG